jgi:hypothetical protein
LFCGSTGVDPPTGHRVQSASISAISLGPRAAFANAHPEERAPCD